ncbi:MAG TPA: hypothetical protein VMY35_19185 [Phycisphaerae bacterium]|nr:hypothetical protein [Phycisphaerae bacterium]
MENLQGALIGRLKNVRFERVKQWRAVSSDPERDDNKERRDEHFASLDKYNLTAGIPARYRRWRLWDFKPDTASDAVAFLERGGAATLFLHGVVGTGKTCLASATLSAWRWSGGACNLDCPGDCGIGKREVGLFLPAYEAAARLRNLDRCEAAMNEWAGARLLVLDDIGANRATPHVTEQLLFLLQRRYDECAKTIVTSNLDLSGIEGTLGERAASRLQEGMLIELTGGDKRAGKKKAGGA